jgi:hypothetical protein
VPEQLSRGTHHNPIILAHNFKKLPTEKEIHFLQTTMKASIFTYILPFLAANIVSGGTLTSALMCSPETRVQHQHASLGVSGGALKTKKAHNRLLGFGTRSQLQRKAAFLPVETDASASHAATGTLPGASLVSKARSVLQVNEKDGLTLRQRMAKKGFATFLTFTLLSNLSATGTMSFAWYLFSMKTGMSPLFPGQWKPFLALNATFMAMDSVLKPIRFAVAIATAPYADRVMVWLKNKFNGSKSAATAAAFAVVVAASFGMFAGGIALASSFSGVAVFAP